MILVTLAIQPHLSIKHTHTHSCSGGVLAAVSTATPESTQHFFGSPGSMDSRSPCAAHENPQIAWDLSLQPQRDEKLALGSGTSANLSFNVSHISTT